jgi:hypothetical protein
MYACRVDLEVNASNVVVQYVSGQKFAECGIDRGDKNRNE